MNFGLKEILLIIFCFIPISIIIGKAALNINLIIFDVIVLIYLFKFIKLSGIKFNQQSIIFFCFLTILGLMYLSENLELSK